MSFESLGASQQHAFSQRPSAQPLSQTGQMVGWLVYGTLLVIGLFIGLVTGTERGKTTTVAKTTKDKEDAKPETPKTDSPKSNLKTTLETPTTSTPKETPKIDSKPNTPPVTIPPKSDPKANTPAVTAMPKTDPKPSMPAVTTAPKVDPKPSVPVATTPPKSDPPAKKEELKPVSFKTDVLPILRTHCLNCHGAAGKAKGDVDLTTLAKTLKSPSENGKMIVPGKPNESDFYTSITDRGMPKDRTPPTQGEMLILKNWILTGAKERRRGVRRKRRSED